MSTPLVVLLLLLFFGNVLALGLLFAWHYVSERERLRRDGVWHDAVARHLVQLSGLVARNDFGSVVGFVQSHPTVAIKALAEAGFVTMTRSDWNALFESLKAAQPPRGMTVQEWIERGGEQPPAR